MNHQFTPQQIDRTDDSRTRRFPVMQQLFLLALVLALIFGGAYLPQVIADRSDESDTNVAAPIQPIDVIERPTLIEPLEEVSIASKAAFVWDVREQRMLYSKAPDSPLPLASITKLMTALLAYELVDENETVSLSTTAIYQEGDSGLLNGETFARGTLSDFALMTSSNDAAYALASATGALLDEERPAANFVAGMNVRAEELGLTNMQFYNPTGLDLNEREPGAVGSARDVTFLMEYILKEHPELLESTQQAASRVYNESGTYHDGTNTNVLVSEIPNLIGSKTGYTDLAGGNLVVAYDVGFNRPIIVTVLGSSLNGRFNDVMTLVEAVAANTNPAE